MLVIKENQREVLTIGGRKLGKEQEKRKKPTLQAKGKENIYEMCVKVTGTSSDPVVRNGKYGKL